MTYTVAELLGDPELATISLTPGVGEQREITWAHVCELADPWNWLGDGAQPAEVRARLSHDAGYGPAYLAPVCAFHD